LSPEDGRETSAPVTGQCASGPEDNLGAENSAATPETPESLPDASESSYSSDAPSAGGAQEAQTETDAAYWRAGIVNDFRVWLDEFDAETSSAESPAEDDASAPDLFTLFGELAALRQETRALARAAHQNGRQMETLSEGLRSELLAQSAVLSHAASDLKTQLPAARRESQLAVLTEILSILDGVDNGIQALLARPAPPWPWRAAVLRERRETARAQRMIMDKINDSLRRLNVTPIAERGQAFDPRVMRAVAVSERGDAVAGTVTVIIRQGYRKDDQILQIAEVEVKQ